MADPVQPPRPSLLLLEDETSLVGALTAHLESEYEIEVAGTVDEARLLLGSRHFAIILSDHMLPGEAQGLDFLVEALERQPTAKRILMTGYLNPELLGRSLTLAKLSSCLLKPLDMAELKQELRNALDT
jgi:DNA-binding NtrC family response regulator